MSAKKTTTTKRSGLIEIQGYKLTPDRYREYMRALESRSSPAIGADKRARELALQGVLFRHSAKGQAEGIVRTVYHELINRALSDMHAVMDFPWHNRDPRVVDAGRSILRIAAKKCEQAQRQLRQLDAHFARDARS